MLKSRSARQCPYLPYIAAAAFCVVLFAIIGWEILYMLAYRRMVASIPLIGVGPKIRNIVFDAEHYYRFAPIDNEGRSSIDSEWCVEIQHEVVPAGCVGAPNCVLRLSPRLTERLEEASHYLFENTAPVLPSAEDSLRRLIRSSEASLPFLLKFVGSKKKVHPIVASRVFPRISMQESGASKIHLFQGTQHELALLCLGRVLRQETLIYSGATLTGFSSVFWESDITTSSNGQEPSKRVAISFLTL